MAKIIEARALLTAKDEASAKFAQLAKNIERIGKTQATVARSGSAEMQAMAKKIDSIDAFRKVSRDLDQASLAFRRAKQEAGALKSAVDAAGTPSRQMARDYANAAKAVDLTREAFKRQGQAVREARSSLEGAGIPIKKLADSQKNLEAQIKSATAALQKQGQVVTKSPLNIAAGAPRQAYPAHQGSVAGIVGGGIVAHKAKDIGKKAVMDAGQFDYALRRQQAFAEMSEEDQNKVLLPQARRIATDTKFSNIDVVEAQTTVANRLPKDVKNADTIAPIIDQTKNYALAMKGTDMDMAAQAVTGFLMSTGKDIGTKDKAEAESRRASNMLIRMAKLGGMSHDDIMPFVQRGASAGRIAGLSDETMGALAIGMKRSNISGDQSGTALRTLSAKLVAPTDKGLSALATAGIDYSQFSKMPGGLSVDSLEGKFKQDFGKGFTPEIREKLTEALGNTETVSNRGQFTEAVTDAVASLFTSKADGTMKAADRQKVAKKVGDFHKFSTESVDSEGLLQAILSKDPTLGVLNAFATEKHGNKLGLVAKSFDSFQSDRDQLKNTPGDFGDKIAAKITGGLGGALERLTGSVENAYLAIGRANEGWVTPSVDKMGNLIDAIASAPPKIVEFVSQVGLAAGALLGLNAAAGALGLASAGAGAIGATGAAASLGTGARLLGMGARGGAIGLGVAGMGYGLYELIKAIETKGPQGEKQFRGSALSGDQGNYDRSMQAQRERNRDPEAARGRGFSGIGDVSKLEATVKTPIPVDVSGKLDPVELKGQANVNVMVKVDGGRVTGMSSNSSGHIKADAGTALGEFRGSGE